MGVIWGIAIEDIAGETCLRAWTHYGPGNQCFACPLSAPPVVDMGGCQNYGPFLGILVIRCRIIIVIQKGTIILTTTHMTMTEIEYQFQAEVHLGRVFLHKDVPTTIVQELGNHFN